MRILMLAQFYPPTIGGVERHVRDLSTELAAHGHDVSVATLWQQGLPEFEIDQGVHIHRIRGSLQRAAMLFSESNRRHLPPFPDPEAMWAIRRIIIRERPDIVHAHNWIVHSFTPLKSWSKAKLVVTLHDCSHVCAQMRFMCRGALCSGPSITKCLVCASDHYGVVKGVPTTLANWMWGKVERQIVDMFLPVSRAIAEVNQLDKYGVSYCIVPNFVPNDIDILPDDDHPILSQLPKGDYLLFVGDLARDKGVEVLLKAYAEMRSPIPLVLIGRQVDDFSKQLLASVLILQSLPHEAVMSAWSRCSIALMPSLCLDACPTVTMEAMAMGRPVIASSIGGLLDIVLDGETGFLVPPNDWHALQKAIRCLIDDEALRKCMGARAKQRVIEFQASTVISRIEKIYQEVLQT
jgi:glycosyltransferase involved in cell wall biosynthesis